MQQDRVRWGYPRFFSDDIDENHEIINISGEDARHINTVLRMKKGDLAVICDGKGMDYLCELTLTGKSFSEFVILESRENHAEPDIEVTLYQAVPKGDKLDFIVQKAVELGASKIVPFISKRCVSKPDSKSASKKQERLQRIAYEAAKQSGRGIVPAVMPFTDFISAVNGIDDDTIAIIFYECGGVRINTLDINKKRCAVFIGSEGGFEQSEVDYAKSKGFHVGYLGERILRCETAPVTALSLLMNVTENL